MYSARGSPKPSACSPRGKGGPSLLALRVAEFPARSLRHTLDEPASFYTCVLAFHRGGDPSKALVSGGVSVLLSHLPRRINSERLAGAQPQPEPPVTL